MTSNDLLFNEGLPDNPLPLLAEWFDYAKQNTTKPNWNAFMLATTSTTNQPSVRAVLMKYFNQQTGEITFYTNYHSRKATEISANPKIALVFHWDDLERQIRIEGTTEKAPPETSDAYFQTRDRESQIGAWASPQSSELTGWEQLLEKVMHYAMKFPANQPVPRPPHWGGYIITPQKIELWHGRTGRIHERIRFKKPSSNQPWQPTWLAP